jgi:hypothetical protein
MLEEKLVKTSKTETLYKIWRLSNWIFSGEKHSLAAESISEEPGYSEFKVRAFLNRPKYHIFNGCDRFPRVENPGDENKFRFFRSIEEAEKAKLEICRNCQKKLRGFRGYPDENAPSNPPA